MENKRIAEFLQKLMDENGLSSNQLAREIGLDKSSISRVINGTRNPGLVFCKKLADYAGYPRIVILVLAGHIELSVERERLKASEQNAIASLIDKMLF